MICDFPRLSSLEKKWGGRWFGVGEWLFVRCEHGKSVRHLLAMGRVLRFRPALAGLYSGSPDSLDIRKEWPEAKRRTMSEHLAQRGVSCKS